MTDRSGWRRTTRARLRRRTSAIRLAKLGSPARTVVTINLVVLSALALLVLSGIRGPTVDLGFAGLAYQPLVHPTAVLAAGAAAIALKMATYGPGTARRTTAAVGVLALVVAALAQLPALPGRPGWVLGSLAFTAFALPDLRRRGWSGAQLVALAVPFALTAAAVADATEVDRAFAALKVAQLVPMIGITLGLSVAVSVAATLQTRHERLAPLLRPGRTRAVVVAVMLAKVGTLVLLYVGAFGEFFGGPAMWRPRLGQPLSWLHAVVVAGLIAVIAIRSTRRPLVPWRSNGILLGLAVAAALPSLAFLGASAVTLAMDALTPFADPTPVLALAERVIDRYEAIAVVVAASILLLGILALTARRPATTGGSLLLLAGVWLLPPVTGGWLTGRGVDVPTFWAAPGQVDAALTAGVAVALLTRRPAALDQSVLLRLLVLPFLIIFGAGALPAAWTSGLANVLLVGGVAFALALRAPPPGTDPVAYDSAASRLVAVNVVILAAYVLLPTGADIEGPLAASGTLALLWLAVPAAGVLVAEARTRP